MGNPPGSGGEIDSSQRRQRRASSVPAPTPSPSLPPTPWDANNGARVSDREPSLRSGRPLPQPCRRPAPCRGSPTPSRRVEAETENKGTSATGRRRGKRTEEGKLGLRRTHHTAAWASDEVR